MVSQNTQVTKVKVETYRPEDQKRTFSNFVEVTTTDTEVSIRFADVKPARSQKEVDEAQATGKVAVPISEEILMPKNIAIELSKILQKHLHVSNK